MAGPRIARRGARGVWLAVFAALVWLVGAAATSLMAQSDVAQIPTDAAKPTAGRPPAETVVDVRVRGNSSVPLAKIEQKIRTRAGRPFDTELVEQDVRRLNQSKLFVNVKTFTQRVDGGVVVLFEVVERPNLQYVRYVGNSALTDKKLREKAGIKKGDPLDPFAVEEARRKIAEFYEEKGFSRARVVVAEGNKIDDKGAVFLINEGQKQRIFWTQFVGNTVVSAARLRAAVIESKPGIFWYFKGEVDRKKIDEDCNRLVAYYRGLGFFNAQVGRELSFNEGQNWLTLTFVIDEGPRYKIRNVEVVGNTKFAKAELVENLKLAPGKFFTQSEMEYDQRFMQDKYGGIGYVFAKVEPDPRFLEEPGQLDLVYNVTEGDRYRVGRINVAIKGENPRTRINTVINRMSLRPGDIVDTREIRASERRLQAAGLFLVDPAQGVKPKIVFTPPELDKLDDEGEESVARQPAPPAGRHHGIRGQSPEPAPSQQYWSQQAAAFRSEDRLVDLTVEAVELPSGAAAPATMPANQSVEMPANGMAPVAGPTEVAPAGYVPMPAGVPPQPTSYNWPTAAPAGAQEPILVRGQYTPDAGREIPDLPPRLPWLGGRKATTQTTSQSYSSQGVSTGPTYTAAPAQTTAPSGPYTANGSVVGQNTAQNPLTAVSPPSAPVPQADPQGRVYGTSPTQPASPSQAGVGFAHGSAMASAAPATPAQPAGVNASTYPGEGSVFAHPDDLTRPLTLDVEAKETETGRFMVGVGVNSDAGLMGSIVIDERNFDWTRIPRSWEDIRNGTAWRGAGQGFRIEAVPGTQVQRYLINFREPYLLDTDVGMSLSGYYNQRYFQEWFEQRVGGRAGLSYQFSHDLSGSVAFRGESIALSSPIQTIWGVPPDIEAAVGTAGLYGFQAALAHDTRDNAFLATEGHFFELSFEQVIGTYQFPHAELDLRRYFTLHQRADGSGRHVLTLSGRFGWLGDGAPVFERFYGGGFTNLRGFAFRGVSPRQYGVAVGGNAIVLASAEYMFPITADDMLRGVVFCDTGTIEPSLDNWVDSYRAAPGFGLRIMIPAMGPAPIALDFAFPVSTNPGDRQEVFSFFVGINR